ncbi:peptide/nickel transport system permease protein [Aerococcus sp. 150760007-1]|uniref:ABC transporter permease n=1 Tax=Aerococcus urinaeequi TaxID=51665 RepID=A0ABR5ZWV4_9LACT|nr:MULTISPECIES: ABC transporter permease [Lactobacillales]KAF3300416.1 ABC transporter permease subunit [Carnobacterium sp. PL17RED31]KAF3300828.1 ABC transporter permease subunit [Carnobacterium sp. PL26RED25]KAF3304401.1 ABC transporter permease subunit [Carnobacterium sp. PL17GRE32]KAF3305247.1 ABC transporter permease subunit [Carnobacterium sp. PL24RED07]MBA5746165.1 ABC transporter permease [Aerococcus urinaeequi]
MIKYLSKRLLLIVPVLLIISILAFAMIQMAPGDIADLYQSPDATPEQIEMIRENLGLNDSIVVQYWRWLTNLFTGDLGFSFRTRTAVTGLIGEALLPTLQLMFGTLIVAYIVAIPLGIYAANHKNTWVDHLLTTFSFAGVSMPNFFLGMLLIYFFSVELGWLPIGGRENLSGDMTFWQGLSYYVLPTLVLGASYCANMTRYVRSTVIGINEQNYMRTAVAKGLKEEDMIKRHTLPNALVPILTVMGSDIPRLIGGAVVTEQVFRWPGIGSLMMASINARDYPVIMTITLISAFAVLACNLLVDVSYAYVDPRIRYE